MSGKSIFDKLWDRHVITGQEGQPQLLYVDQHYVHEVTSPQAFQGLRDTGRPVRCPDLTFATFDHNVSTVDIHNIRDVISKAQMDALAKNIEDFGIPHAPTVRNIRALSTWLDQKQVGPSQVSSLSVGIAIRRPTEHLEPLPLGLVLLKWSTFSLHKQSGRSNLSDS